MNKQPTSCLLCNTLTSIFSLQYPYVVKQTDRENKRNNLPEDSFDVEPICISKLTRKRGNMTAGHCDSFGGILEGKAHNTPFTILTKF